MVRSDVAKGKGHASSKRDSRVPPLLQLNIKLAVIVMAHAPSQFARVATLPARLLILTGYINLPRSW
jgi:hypothetical protein